MTGCGVGDSEEYLAEGEGPRVRGELGVTVVPKMLRVGDRVSLKEGDRSVQSPNTGGFIESQVDRDKDVL